MPRGMQRPTPALAPGGRSRRCSGFTLEARAVVGLHPWAPGWPAATTLSPLPQQLSFLFIGSSDTTSSNHCCGVGISQFFSIPLTCCRRGAGSSLLLDVLAAALRETGQAQGWDVAQTFFLTQNHHLKAHFTWPALCSLCLML